MGIVMDMCTGVYMQYPMISLPSPKIFAFYILSAGSSFVGTQFIIISIKADSHRHCHCLPTPHQPSFQPSWKAIILIRNCPLPVVVLQSSGAAVPCRSTTNQPRKLHTVETIITYGKLSRIRFLPGNLFSSAKLQQINYKNAEELHKKSGISKTLRHDEYKCGRELCVRRSDVLGSHKTIEFMFVGLYVCMFVCLYVGRGETT